MSGPDLPPRLGGGGVEAAPTDPAPDLAETDERRFM